jgi:hypothetical protein
MSVPGRFRAEPLEEKAYAWHSIVTVLFNRIAAIGGEQPACAIAG